MSKSPLKIAFFGMPGSGFSARLFRDMVGMAHADPVNLQIAQLVVPLRPEALSDPRIPLSKVTGGLLETARQEGIAIAGFPDPGDTAFTAMWDTEAPDLLIVGCFPFKIPSAILQMASLGGWNLHPSLLPAYRGADPLFWQLRDGLDETAITLHQLTEQLDAGDILGQSRHSVVAGIGAGQLSLQLAQLGSSLLDETIQALLTDQLSATPQRPGGASYQPPPQARDFFLDDSWTAERAWRFIKGTQEYGKHFLLQSSIGEVMFKDVAGYQKGKTVNESHITSDQLHIQMSDGTLSIPLGAVLNMEGLKLT